MLDKIFRGVFDSDMTAVISVSDFLLCVGVSLVIGLLLGLCYMYRSRYTKSFIVTLALLPAVVCDAEFRSSEPGEPLYSSKMPLWTKGNLFAIPYYLWQNRGASDMRIFIPFY